MKVITTITVATGALTPLMSALASTQYRQASRLVPRLASRLSDHQAPTKTLITRHNNSEKNFTHDELFALRGSSPPGPPTL